MAILIWENGVMIKLKGKEFINIQMMHNILECEKEINRMVSEKKFGQMGRSMSAIITKGKNMGKEILFGLMDHAILDYFKIIILKGWVFIHGLMEESIKENELETKCMVKGHFYGKMGGHIEDSISLIKRRDMENFFGQMEGSILVCGRVKNLNYLNIN